MEFSIIGAVCLLFLHLDFSIIGAVCLLIPVVVIVVGAVWYVWRDKEDEK